MERRFVLFLVLAFAIFIGYFALVQQLFPPAAKKPPAKPKAAAEEQAEIKEKGKEAEKAPGEGEAKPQVGQAPAAETPSAEEKSPKESAPEEKPPQGAVAEEPAIPEKWITLGSADKSDPYRMLVTLSNRGATLVRIELNSPRYCDIDNRSGYLGHLVMDKTVEGSGLPVQVVGPGTPAAKAGIKAGDIIKGIKGKSVTSYKSLESILSKTKPDQTVEIAIRRNDEELVLPAKLTRYPLSVVAPENDDPCSFLLTMQQIGNERIADDEINQPVELGRELKGVELRKTTWQIVEADQTHAVFAKKLPQYGLEVFKTYRLATVPKDFTSDPDYKAYHLEFSVKIVNHGETAKKVAYRLDGPNGLPTEGWWYASKVSRNWGGTGLRDVVVSFEQNVPKMVGCPTIAGDKLGPPWQDQSLSFIGVDAQYFSVVSIPHKENPQEIWFAASQAIRVGAVDHKHINLTNTSFRLISLAQEIKPGREFTHKFDVFAGPKRPALLNQYGLKELVYYGWPIFAGPAVLLSWILHWFYFVVRNYGLAIMLLTVLVRGCMFPLSIKQALGAQKMQALQPEIKRIAEKYKNDLEARSKAQQELFRKHNYNPFSGCLVLFIQLPIFIGLYRSLMVDVELRDAPLISYAVRWCSNLAAPDMLFNWSSFMPEFVNNGVGLFGLGPYFNLLPILTVFLFIWQQKMFMPPAADEQAAMQQKLMKYMMIFMGVLFFKVASGLCIYFIASTLWSLAERQFLPKTTPSGGAAPTAKTPARRVAAGSSDGNGNVLKSKKSKGKK
jgi:YidC/Oxa1 family membrane protein insertase